MDLPFPLRHSGPKFYGSTDGRAVIFVIITLQFSSRDVASVGSYESPCLYIFQDLVQTHTSKRTGEFLV